MPGIFDPTKAFTTKPHPYSLHWAGVDIVDPTSTKGVVVPLQSVTVHEVGANGPSSMEFQFLDSRRQYSLAAVARVQLNDWVNGEVMFAGYTTLRSYQPVQPSGNVLQVTATDYNQLLDSHVVPALKYKAGRTDKELIQAVVAHASRSQYIHAHTAFVTQTNGSMPAMDFSHISLRSAIESIQAASGPDRHYYVDFLGRLHYYQGPTESAMGAAPAAIVDTTSGLAAQVGTLRIDFDDSQLANAVYIHGANAAGSGWEKDEVSIKAYGLRQATFDAPQCTTAAHRANVGQHFLKMHKDPLTRGELVFQSATSVGWRVGQTLTLTNTSLGLSGATYPITQIDTTLLPTGVKVRKIAFGDLPARGRRAGVGGGSFTTLGSGGGGIVASPGPIAAPRPVSRMIGIAGIERDATIL